MRRTMQRRPEPEKPQPPARRAPGAPALACWLVLSAATGSARADAPLWELGAGAAALHVPHYRGSEQAHRWLLPVPYLVLRGKVFRADREGTRAVLLDTPRGHLDLSFDASPPLKSADNRARQGMADLATTVELGPKFNLMLARGDGWKLDLRLPLRAAFALDGGARRLGWTFAPLLHLDQRWQGWDLGLSAGPLAAGRCFLPTSTTWPRPMPRPREWPSRPAAVPGGWGVSASTARRLGPWWLAGHLRHDDLGGAAFRASPLVTQQRQFTLGLALGRVLWVSSQQVPERP
ncbi:MAG: MipA/OmpV family protein [Leptothrix sp. (in: Bacteria)]|nr:MipA/OmpV family protein [Leptothrix sp. (in: b-proteobacteria)]